MPTTSPPRAGDLDEAGLVSSATEREAMEIERDADDACLAFLLERVLSERGPEADWDGEVVGVIGAGAFVRFGDEGFEGFLPARKLRGEWWSLNEEGTALVGEESGKRAADGRSRARRGREGVRAARPRRPTADNGLMADVARNRQASYRYHLPDKWECGIQLQGSEVKSLRNGGVQLKDAYATLTEGEVWLHNMHIAPYQHAPRRKPRARAAAQAADAQARDRAPDREDPAEGADADPDPRSTSRARTRRSRSRSAKGKDLHDKRRDLKAKDQKREIERALRER